MEEITPEDSVVPIYLVPLTPEQENEMAEHASLYEEEVSARELAATQKEAAQTSALAKLALLGLTEEEAKAVIGL